MADPIRNLPGFFHCERLGCTLFPETCGKRSVRSREGDPRMLPCYGCETGEENARLHELKPSKNPSQRFLLDIAKGRSAEARARRIAAKTGEGPRTYPEQVKEATEILARIDKRRAK